MASISATINLYDRVSSPINNMLSALDNLCSTFESVESSMDNSFDSSTINQARQSIEAAARQTADLGEQHEEYNDEVEKSSSLLSGLGGKIGALVGAYVGMETVKQAIDYASDLAEVQNVVDVTFGKSASTVNEWAKTTLDAFGLNEKTALQFSGTMGAMLKSSGMSGDAVMEMSTKITELAGDMASFYNLEGEEAFNKLRSGISGETEPLKQLGINMSVANLEAYALSQGIKTAYNEMSQAEQVSLRYNYLLQATADAQGDFARTADSFSNQMKLLKENWLAFTGEVVSKALPILAQGIQMLNTSIGFLAANWSTIEPIAIGLIIIIGLYVIALAAYNAVQAKSIGLTKLKAFQEKVHAASLMMSTGATFAATAAQHGFNAALLACPLTWILLIIIAVIAAIYAIVAAINKVTGKTISATGVIVGVLMTALAFIGNLFVAAINIVIDVFVVLWNFIASFVNFFGNVFTDPIGSIARLFFDLVDTVLGLLQTLARGIDAVFGSNLAGSIQGWRNSLDGWVDDTFGGEKEIMAKVSGEDWHLNRFDYSDAYNKGYAWGANSGESLVEDDETALNIADTADNTEAIADKLDITNEDLKYLRDIAERDVINRFTTAEIKVDMTNNNNVSSNMDLDGMVNYLVIGVNEAIEKVAEGVHQ